MWVTFFHIVGRVDDHHPAAAQGGPGGQPGLHPADLVDGDIPLDLEGLTLGLLLFLGIVERQVIEHQHVGMGSAFGLPDPRLGDQLGGSSAGKKAFSEAFDTGQNPGVVHPGRAARRAPLTPGFIVAGKALLDQNPNPSEQEVREWLAGNLCRCTGYDRIVRAVMEAARS